MSTGTERDTFRTVVLSPYRKGAGPRFRLDMWDTGRRDSRGCTKIGYQLTQVEHGKRTILFTGSEFCSAPMYADDSDQLVAALLGFLTLRPGDTDEEYFEDYTDEQLAYCSEHAEALACEALSRFGED